MSEALKFVRDIAVDRSLPIAIKIPRTSGDQGPVESERSSDDGVERIPASGLKQKGAQMLRTGPSSLAATDPRDAQQDRSAWLYSTGNVLWSVMSGGYSGSYLGARCTGSKDSKNSQARKDRTGESGEGWNGINR